MIRVFLSHQKADTARAEEIARRLSTHHGIDSYLDSIDPQLGKPGADLARYIRREMGKCTQLLAITSSVTVNSQWVPWEVGVATEKDYPLATFSSSRSLIPEFLRSWPYLTSLGDIDQYALASKYADRTKVLNEHFSTASAARNEATKTFFTDLRSRLGQ